MKRKISLKWITTLAEIWIVSEMRNRRGIRVQMRKTSWTM